MNSTSRAWIVSVLLLIATMAFTTGCPDNVTPKDGGGENVSPDVVTTDNTPKVTCSTGALCVHIENDQVRVCDILLKNDKALSQPLVGFHDDTMGQFKYLDSRLAVSLITKKDQPFGKTNAAIVVKMNAGVGKLELAKATCYDGNGKKVEKPAIALGRP